MARWAAPLLRLGVLLALVCASTADTPPFWPEENCINLIDSHDYSSGRVYGDMGGGEERWDNMISPSFRAASPAVNPYDASFEEFAYATYPPGTTGASAYRRYAGPMLNDTTTPCRLKARVGVPMSITVYAEDMDAGDSVRIYVLEDPGIPNGAYVSADEAHQRCLPTNVDGPGFSQVSVGGDLGPCPHCQDTGEFTYGTKVVPASPDNKLAQLAINFTTSGARCTRADRSAGQCPGAALPMRARVWCTEGPHQATKGYGNGKLEPASEHERLRKRTLTWTPLPEQGICLHPTHCTFIVRFQAFDSDGMNSVIKTYEIDVIKATPQYLKGTFGLILNGAQEKFQDPVTNEESHVSSTTYEPQTPSEAYTSAAVSGAYHWMVSEKVYQTYINCPMEFAIGVEANGYDVNLQYTSNTMPPAATIEWRRWTQACEDHQTEGEDVWTDKYGRTCLEYVTRGWCKDGVPGPNFAGGHSSATGPGIGGSYTAMARDGFVPADRACCACGAGRASTCASRTSAAACRDNAANILGGMRVYPPQNGCTWDGTRCHGSTHPFWVDPGVLSPQWSVSTTPPTARRVMAIFKWTPVRGMEGSSHVVCFRGRDALGTAALPEVCSTMHVAKCHYCVRVGETLKYVAEQYNFDTNWLRLWNYNFQLTDPDLILRSFLPVVIGSTYKVQPGDTLARIAARLRTTVKKILEVNPDMHSPEIEPNQVGLSSIRLLRASPALPRLRRRVCRVAVLVHALCSMFVSSWALRPAPAGRGADDVAPSDAACLGGAAPLYHALHGGGVQGGALESVQWRGHPWCGRILR
jgi:hypothetical protein